MATEHQPTIVCFLGFRATADTLETFRPAAWDLAMKTGARVLSVACASAAELSHTAPVEAGLAAYAWLLGEGCDVDRTTFAHDPSGGPLVAAIRVAAATRGLPLPPNDHTVAVIRCGPRSR